MSEFRNTSPFSHPQSPVDSLPRIVDDYMENLFGAILNGLVWVGSVKVKDGEDNIVTAFKLIVTPLRSKLLISFCLQSLAFMTSYVLMRWLNGGLIGGITFAFQSLVMLFFVVMLITFGQRSWRKTTGQPLRLEKWLRWLRMLSLFFGVVLLVAAVVEKSFSDFYAGSAFMLGMASLYCLTDALFPLRLIEVRVVDDDDEAVSQSDDLDPDDVHPGGTYDYPDFGDLDLTGRTEPSGNWELRIVPTVPRGDEYCVQLVGPSGLFIRSADTFPSKSIASDVAIAYQTRIREIEVVEIAHGVD